MSFIDANCDNDYSYGVQPLLVNIRLECNPEPRDREGKDFDSVSSRQSTPVVNATELEHAKLLARTSREALARFPAGRAMLEAENHGNSAEDPGYWFEIAAFYDAQRLRLRYEALERFYKHLGGINSRSRRSARILAQKRQNADDCAASTPSLHNTTNSSKKENHTAPVAGASIKTASGMMLTDGSVVQTSSNEYTTPTSNMPRPEEPTSERNRKGDRYWMEQADYYNAAYQKLYREALERRKPKREESTKPPPRASRPMTRARQSIFTEGTAQGSVDKSQCAAASSQSPYKKANGSNKGTSRRTSTTRRGGKRQYCLRDAGVTGTVSSGYTTQTPNKLKQVRSAGQGYPKGSTRRRLQMVASHRVEKSSRRTLNQPVEPISSRLRSSTRLLSGG